MVPSDLIQGRSKKSFFLWDMDKTKWCNGFYIQFRQNLAKETCFYDEQLKSYENKYWKPEVRERKKTAVHGTLEMTYMAVKSNFQQVLQKTLIPTMNT